MRIPRLSDLTFDKFYFGKGSTVDTHAYQCVEIPEIEIRIHIPHGRLKDNIKHQQVFLQGDSTNYLTVRRAYHQWKQSLKSGTA